jgi:ubiquinone/menaquinone biosynthesis C-methylase UbiE
MNRPGIVTDLAVEFGPPEQAATRHDKTMCLVKETIAQLVQRYVPNGSSLLEVGGDTGWQTLAYRDRLASPSRAVIYDWQDRRLQHVKTAGVGFCEVNIETDSFPDPSGSFDVVVCNQVLEHIKNIYHPLTEMHRVLKMGGFLIVSVPNVSALHNCFLLLLGMQPTTMAIFGSHVRGFAIHSMSRFLTRNGHFRICTLKGFGLHPFTSMELPWIFKTYCHTPVWVLQKQSSDLAPWVAERSATYTTTKF